MEKEVKALNILILPITFSDLEYLYSLEFPKLPNGKTHNDPLDRLIISQSLNRDIKLISKDDKFQHYEVNLFW